MIARELHRNDRTPLEPVKTELLAEVLRQRGEARVRVSGSSMLPSVWPGDILVVCRENPLRVLQGEIVLVARQARLFVHRVVEKSWHTERLFLVTKGDFLPDKDQPVAPGELLGRVTWISRGRRRIKLDSARQRLLGRIISRLPWFGSFLYLVAKLFGFLPRPRRTSGHDSAGIVAVPTFARTEITNLVVR